MSPCLVIFLEPSITLAMAENWPILEISRDEELFRPVGPQWSGFYNWLRDAQGQLLGVRYYPWASTSFVLKAADTLPYATQGQHDDLAIFFALNRDFDLASSRDQDFLYDQVFLGPDSKCAMTFAKDRFTSAELAHTRQAKWIAPRFSYGSRK